MATKKLQIWTPDEDEQTPGEESTDWKHIIFLPFQGVWELCLMISIFFNSLLSIYDQWFTKETDFAISLLYYLCEVMYLFDCALTIMHRNMTKTRKKRCYRPRNLGMIIVDCLTLHPFYEIKYFLSLTNYSTGHDVFRNDYKWKCVIRTYRLFIFENKKMNQVGLNQLMVLPVQRLIKIATLGQIFAAVIYVSSKKDPFDWTADLTVFGFDGNSSVSQWSVCFMMMTGVVLNNWPVVVGAETNTERIIFTSAMVFGFIICITLFVGRLVLIFIRIDRTYFDYTIHVAKIMRLLDEWEVDRELKSNTFDYYNMFYKKRRGMRDMPGLFRVLPPSLQKEVTVDIYWEAFRHTHLFAHTDMSFKRSVSLVMKSEFLLPGEFLFRVGELRAKMVYLVSGVIQALSKEDDDSPLISFSSGTVLGETACLMPTVSVSNLRAVTYCEVQSLNLSDLYQVLLKYPLVTRTVRTLLEKRLDVAQAGISKRRARQSDGEYTDISIKNVRDRWNEIARYSKKPDSMLPLAKEEKIDCLAANLDLLVLSHDVELRVESICLSGRCPCVMDPDTSFRKFCDYIVILAIVIQSVIIPKAAFFQGEMSPNDLSICVLMDVIYTFDIYLQLSTAVRDKSRLITDYNELIIKVLKKLTFLVDIVATLPVDYLIMISVKDANMGMCKLPRLLKIYKIFTVLLSLQYNISVNTTAVRVTRWFVFYVITIYWLTAILYGLARYIEVAAEFWESIVLTFCFYVGFGATNVKSYTLTEMVAFFIFSLFGHYVYCLGITELVASAVLKLRSAEAGQVHFWAMKSGLLRQILEPGIRKRLSRFLYFHHAVRGYQVAGKQSIFSDAPTELRNEIVRHRIIDCLKKVPLFQNAQRDVLRYICNHAEIKLVPPEALLMNNEVKSDTLYLIMRGRCIMSSYLPGDLERKATSILEIGGAFPLLETLHDTFSFVTVQCLTVVEVLLIKTHVLRSALRTNARDYRCFEEALKDHKSIYGSILERKGARLPPMRSTIPSKGKGSIFEYTIRDVDNIEFNKSIYKKPFQDLGMWGFIRFFLLKKTIRPTSWFYISWEVTRCSSLIIYFFYINIRYGILGYYWSIKNLSLLSLGFDLIALIDLYIRLHCQYYNEKGILVTHPLYTANNYIKTAFVMDCLGIVQVHNVGLDGLFGDQYRLWIQLGVSVATRCCQLYRPFKGLTYLENKYHGKTRNTINTVKYVLFTLLCISLGCSLTMLVMCDQKYHVFHCHIAKRSPDPPGLYQYVYYLYTATVCMTLSSAGNVIENRTHLILTVFLLILFVVLKWLIFMSITSRGVGGNVELTIYRDRMRNYVKFLKNAFISTEDKQLIVSHYEYVWKKTHGLDIHAMLKNFHPQLEQDLARDVYQDCLRHVPLFAGEHASLFQVIAHMLHQEFYTKDSKIIRCNDIQNKLFIVYDGMVDIYMAGTLMCGLRTGGVFGCFLKTGSNRQTINAISRIHCVVLAIDAKLFCKAVETFPRIAERLQRATAVGCEYMQELQNSSLNFDEEQQHVHAHSTSPTFYEKVLIFENNPTYRFFDYITNVHIYPLSSIVILISTFIHLYSSPPPYILGICYITDFVHFIKMCCKCHLIYVDPDSGRRVSNPDAIRRKYLKSGFWFDFFTLLPFEFVANCYTENGILYNLCFLNRSLRFLFLVLYYYQCEERLLMKDHLKWTYMIYSVLFQVHLLLCLWLLIACPYDKCWHTLDVANTNFNRTQTVSQSTILAYLYVINLYTGTGLKSMTPKGVPELTVTIGIMIVTQVLVMNLCANYVSYMMVNKYNFINYEVKFQSLRVYLQNLKLSLFLYSKVWKYCVRLWSQERGNWLPVLITESPPCLKENVLQILYGRHLSNHFLFRDTHVDFLRQLIVQLDRFVFATGDSVVEKGDADCCMYFVHSGEIIQLNVAGNIEHYMGTLVAGDSFGEAQGLLCIPHKYSYRSKGDSEVLILNKSKWNFLLKWFPASKEQILTKGVFHDLLDEDANI